MQYNLLPEAWWHTFQQVFFIVHGIQWNCLIHVCTYAPLELDGDLSSTGMSLELLVRVYHNVARSIGSGKTAQKERFSLHV